MYSIEFERNLHATLNRTPTPRIEPNSKISEPSSIVFYSAQIFQSDGYGIVLFRWKLGYSSFSSGTSESWRSFSTQGIQKGMSFRGVCSSGDATKAVHCFAFSPQTSSNTYAAHGIEYLGTGIDKLRNTRHCLCRMISHLEFQPSLLGHNNVQSSHEHLNALASRSQRLQWCR